MTRRDYIVIADALNRAKPEQHVDSLRHKMNDFPSHGMVAWERTVAAIADALALESRMFKRDVFLRACHMGRAL